ncbi:glycerophosphodiester phosphodiesterase [Aliiglaciecola sp. M165]|uniref:glycerophosphodiester phosphodiesterase n=1 Tax=Aliiglaciecola sp. M165 TaxID=2593649 RepID=UPI0011804082|nr:glycerophosphodiester phosphodiesterase [Aliiglaciecola sp. M165]TRY29385.1 glycerophosphodiester phosphodiesterase [Aliiglaciecola sp. M165]
MSRTSRIVVGIALLFQCTLLIAKPLVIAHRGASGYLPEHTLEAAILAYSQGADYIEQDLVLSKDGVPVVLHDIHLESVTNVEQVFPKRARKDGRYYAIDFTLTELQTLHKHERTDAQGQQVFSGRYQGMSTFKIATFEQHIQLINQLNRQFKKQVGIYPEIKSPAWHKTQGADISQIVVDILRRYDLDRLESNVFVQCFDFAETKRLRNELGVKVKLVQLIAENSWAESTSDYNYLRTASGLAEIAKVAQGIGPWMPQLFDLQAMQPTQLASLAKQQGLQIHPYTFRADALPEGLTTQSTLNILFNILKVDGVFTDFTDVVISHLDATKQP